MHFQDLPPIVQKHFEATTTPYLYQLLFQEFEEEARTGLIDSETRLHRVEHLEQPSTCPVCASEELSHPFATLHANSFRECLDCRSLHRNPRLKPETFGRLLQDSETARLWADRAAQAFDPESRSHEKLFARLEELLGGASLRYCDVGARCGNLVRQAANRGWDAWGVEPSQSACEFMQRQGLQHRHGLFSAKLFEPGSFDCMTLEHVMLNLYAPRALFRDLNAALRPGGLLHFADFNRHSLGMRIHGWRYRALMGRNAILVASIPGLERMLAACGFEVVESTTHTMDVLPEDYAAVLLGHECYWGTGEAYLPAETRLFPDESAKDGLLDGLSALGDALGLGAYYSIIARKTGDAR